MAVVFRDVGTATTGTGAAVTQLSVTIPAAAQVDDIAFLWWSEVSGGLVTNYATPSGWTELLAPQSVNSGTQCIAFCYKALEAGDPSSSVNFGTLTASRRQNLSVAVYSGAIFDSSSSLSSSLSTSTSVPIPGIDPTAVDCMLVGFAAPAHPSAITSLITGTATSGWDERADFGTSTVAAVNHGSQFIQDRQESGGGPFSSVDFTASHSVQYASVVVALAPTGPPPVDVQALTTRSNLRLG